LQDGAATGAAAQDGDGELLAEREIHLGSCLVGVAEHHEILGQLPEAQDRVNAARLAELEQDLVAGEVLLGRREREITQLHVLYYLPDKRRAPGCNVACPEMFDGQAM
jgi:hypothetical protein